MPSNRSGQPIENKAVAATGATLIINQLAWAIFTFWPAARNAVPSASDQLQLASIAASFFTAAASYYAPHTHRPDLPPVVPPVSPANGPTTASVAFETGQAGEDH